MQLHAFNNDVYNRNYRSLFWSFQSCISSFTHTVEHSYFSMSSVFDVSWRGSCHFQSILEEMV